MNFLLIDEKVITIMDYDFIPSTVYQTIVVELLRYSTSIQYVPAFKSYATADSD